MSLKYEPPSEPQTAWAKSVGIVRRTGEKAVDWNHNKGILDWNHTKGVSP